MLAAYAHAPALLLAETRLSSRHAATRDDSGGAAQRPIDE